MGVVSICSISALHINCTYSNSVRSSYHIHNLPAADAEHIWPVVAVAEHVGAAFGLVGLY